MIDTTQLLAEYQRPSVRIGDHVLEGRLLSVPETLRLKARFEALEGNWELTEDLVNFLRELLTAGYGADQAEQILEQPLAVVVAVVMDFFVCQSHRRSPTPAPTEPGSAAPSSS